MTGKIFDSPRTAACACMAGFLLSLVGIFVLPVLPAIVCACAGWALLVIGFVLVLEEA